MEEKMGGLIQLVVVCWVVILILKRMKGESNSGSGKQAPNTTVNTAGANKQQNNGQMPQNPRYGHWGSLPWPHNIPGMQGNLNGRNVPNAQRTPAPQVKDAAKMPGMPAKGEATTAYLAKKAQEDAREHAKDKWEEEKRLRETRGGLAVAERHFEGDPFPEGKRCLVCGYCAAENLVPMVPRTRYSCYFCREPLN